MYLKRIIVKFGGESGQGINSVGTILTKSLNRAGYYTFSNREYPSLIKGGFANYQIDISNSSINSSSSKTNILCCMSERSLEEYITDVLPNGIVIYDGKELELTPSEEEYIKQNNIKVILIDSEEIAKENNAPPIMANAVLAGFIWKILKQNLEILNEAVEEMFEGKNIDMDAERACLQAGYNSPLYEPALSENIDIEELETSNNRKMTMTGNDAISLGALAGGMRAFFGYPMTPATSIFKFLGESANDTKILVKQAENEITAIQMTMGAMYMGTRAMTATSGGGFDLMCETISCSGMSETPLVIVVAQRIGSGTGVPTWTGSGDITAATKIAHGDFPRCVIQIADAKSAFTLIQKAFNIADKYQLPVIVLTEKQIAEGLFSLDALPPNERIERGLQHGEKRYQLTTDGISPRWIPSKDQKPYLHTSDEHTEEGYSTENAQKVWEMSKKRTKKLEKLKAEIPEPEYFGSLDASTILVGSGNTKNPVLDIINTSLSNEDIGYLHYEYIYPVKTERLKELIEQGKRLILIENNETGQLGKLLTEETGYKFNEKLLKFDGRPFFIEDILNYLEKKEV